MEHEGVFAGETDLELEEALQASRLQHEADDQTLQQALRRSMQEGEGFNSCHTHLVILSGIVFSCCTRKVW